jgi:hypothetical protein
VKMRVMPTLRPTSPKVMFLPFKLRGQLQLAGEFVSGAGIEAGPV